MDCSFLSQEGKTVLITGGSRGIGREMALVFADAGADVAISGRKAAGLEEVVGEIKARGRRGLGVIAHSRKPEDLRRLVQGVIDEFGRIDVLINNAAANPAMTALVDTSDEVFDLIMDTNLKSYFILSKLAARDMMTRRRGVIINISSTAGVSPAIGLGAYSISKAAINMLTRALAAELGPHNIKVNAIAPGIIKTGFSEALWSDEKLMARETATTPLKRIGSPGEIARSALYLASAAADFMTGHVLLINGGAVL
ncbi:MAG: SDR family oxidoreductase [Pseudomonadota bacterium]